MSKKISELNSTSTANNSDELVINQNDETKRISKEDLFGSTEESIETLGVNLNTKVNNLIGVSPYDTEETYAVGDYCLYENTLYICIANTIAGNFDSTKWEETSVLDRTGQVKQLYSGTLQGNVSGGREATVSESIYNFKFLLLRPGTKGLYVVAPVVPNFAEIRGMVAHTSSATAIEVFGARGTVSADGKTFTLLNVADINVRTTGTSAPGTPETTITEIWGVR